MKLLVQPLEGEMLRTNRSIVPVGMALLSLSLAAVPFLFNSTWTELRFGSRLTSVTSAWNQIANVFLAVYKPGNVGQLLALKYGSDDTVDLPAEGCEGHAEQVACLESANGTEESDKAIACDAKEPSTELSWTDRSADEKLQPAKCPRSALGAPLKRYRDGVAARGAPVPTANLPRIDVLKMIEVAMKGKAVTKLIESHFADYRIEPRFELNRLVTRSVAPAAFHFTVRREALPCASEPEPALRPQGQMRERLRKAS